MALKLLSILILFSYVANAQNDGIMPSGWKPDWYMTTSIAESEIETGNKVWDELSSSKKRVLERYASKIYRDSNGTLWFKGVEWYNLNTKQRIAFRPRGLKEDVVHISGQALAGAIIEKNISLARFYKKKVKVSDAIYEQRPIGRRYHYGKGGEDGNTRRSGGYEVIYKKVLVKPARYEYRWFIKEIKINISERRKNDDS